jgi:hypothetical protein
MVTIGYTIENEQNLTVYAYVIIMQRYKKLSVLQNRPDKL